jgi:hypothetical protein
MKGESVMDEEIEISKHMTTEEIASEADHWKATAEGLQAKLDTLRVHVERIDEESDDYEEVTTEIVLWALDRHRNDVGDYLDLSDEELQAVYARAKTSGGA